MILILVVGPGEWGGCDNGDDCESREVQFGGRDQAFYISESQSAKVRFTGR